MALTVTNCKNGLTLAGGSVDTWAVFDGTGYTYTFAKTVSNGDFRMFIRAQNYNSTNDTIEFRCYLFGRKNNTTIASYNNDKKSKVKFTVGDGEVTIETAKARMPGSDSSVRCLGYGDVTVNIKTSSASARPMQAVFYGVDGTSDCDKTYTVTGPDMNWNKGSVAITASSVTSSSFTATASNIVTNRMFLSQWDWAIANLTISGSYGDVKGVTNVVSDSTTTSNAESFSSLKAGNKYRVRFRSRFRNYNAFTEASTGVGVHYSITKDVTTTSLAGSISLNSTADMALTYGGSSGTRTISSATGAKSVSPTSGTYASASLSGSTITVKPVKPGTQTITATSAAVAAGTSSATNAYTSASTSFKAVVSKATGSLTVSKSSETLYYAGDSKTITVGGSGGTVSVSSGNTAVCTVSISGTTITLKPGTTLGTTTITVSRAANDYYTAPSNKTISVTLARNPIAKLPTPKTGLKYNGSSQTGVTAATSDYVTLSGSVSGTNAGTYKWSATPKSGYAWSDGTYAAKSGTDWTIAKIDDDWTIPSSVSTGVGKSYSLSVANKSTTSANVPSPTSGTYFDSTYSGTTITVTGKQEGTGTLTVTTAADTNYKARTQTCSVTVSGKQAGYATWSYGNTTASLKETQTLTQTVSNTHGGALSATSSNTKVATVSVSGSSVIATAVGIGTTKITYTVAETTTHTKVTKDVTLTVRPAEVKVGSKTVPVYVGTKPVKRIYKGSTLIL